MGIYTKLQSYLPLKRPHEFAILELCFDQERFTKEEGSRK